MPVDPKERATVGDSGTRKNKGTHEGHENLEWEDSEPRRTRFRPSATSQQGAKVRASQYHLVPFVFFVAVFAQQCLNRGTTVGRFDRPGNAMS